MHSDGALICLLDTTLFSTIAYLIGFGMAGTLIAATAGGLFAILNYRYLSRRIFGVIPIN